MLYSFLASFVFSFFFFFNDPATPEISPLPLPDALPTSRLGAPPRRRRHGRGGERGPGAVPAGAQPPLRDPGAESDARVAAAARGAGSRPPLQLPLRGDRAEGQHRAAERPDPRRTSRATRPRLRRPPRRSPPATRRDLARLSRGAPDRDRRGDDASRAARAAPAQTRTRRAGGCSAATAAGRDPAGRHAMTPHGEDIIAGRLGGHYRWPLTAR